MSGPLALSEFVIDFAAAMSAADAARPVAVRHGGGGTFAPGIGPHPENEVVSMCLTRMAESKPSKYESHKLRVRYPGSRAECDLCLGNAQAWDWAIELKLLRFLGDNGKQNGHMLMHILSPYPQDHSAVTDCAKLVTSGLAARSAIVIFGYEHAEWPLEPAISAFEHLATRSVQLGARCSADTGELVHPVHRQGRVYGWELPSSGRC